MSNQVTIGKRSKAKKEAKIGLVWILSAHISKLAAQNQVQLEL